MLLGGLWHGASWEFSDMGAIHGGYLAFERGHWERKASIIACREICRYLLPFHCPDCLVCFRADTLPDATRYWQACLAWPEQRIIIHYWRIDLQPVLSHKLRHFRDSNSLPMYGTSRGIFLDKIVWCFIVFLLALAALTTQGYNPFIYFIF